MTREIEKTYHRIRELILSEFADVVESISQPHGKLRVHFSNESYLDIWLSRKITGRYAYHWEHRHVNGSLHRHDNRPHEHLEHLEGFPKHFHNGSEMDVKRSSLSDEPEKAVQSFLKFIRKRLKGTNPSRRLEDKEA